MLALGLVFNSLFLNSLFRTLDCLLGAVDDVKAKQADCDAGDLHCVEGLIPEEDANNDEGKGDRDVAYESADADVPTDAIKQDDRDIAAYDAQTEGVGSPVCSVSRPSLPQADKNAVSS